MLVGSVPVLRYLAFTRSPPLPLHIKQLNFIELARVVQQCELTFP